MVYLQVWASMSLEAIMMQLPLASVPLRPARPLIWMYSPLAIHRCSCPSHLRMAVKMTVLAGMLMPIAKVSVANSACMTQGFQACCDRFIRASILVPARAWLLGETCRSQQLTDAMQGATGRTHWPCLRPALQRLRLSWVALHVRPDTKATFLTHGEWSECFTAR